ncbi:YARHG domain-containing protein [Brotaphodocola sp.]|uniref:YARHG domain-containing protein n=1 Tax=Brotaphodocola sp. TaxID=3073577 RepID=UPI003D7D8B90
MRKNLYVLAVLAAASTVCLSACGQKTTENVNLTSSAQTQSSQSQSEIQIAKDGESQTTAETMPLTEAASEMSTEESEKTLEQSPKSDVVQTTATAPASAYPDEYQSYVGRWVNKDSARCSMEIRSNGNGTYAVEITWSNSAAEHYSWTMTGKPSQKRRGGGLDYTDGVRTLVTFLDDNTSQSKVEATGESGNLFVNESRTLLWTDPGENGGEEVEFYYDGEISGTETAGSDYIIAGSDTRKLTEAELSGLTKDQLRLARNEIYARHGLIFQVKDLQDYFSQKSWYSPTVVYAQFDDKVLNTYEKENLELIKKVENSK